MSIAYFKKFNIIKTLFKTPNPQINYGEKCSKAKVKMWPNDHQKQRLRLVTNMLTLLDVVYFYFVGRAATKIPKMIKSLH